MYDVEVKEEEKETESDSRQQGNIVLFLPEVFALAGKMDMLENETLDRPEFITVYIRKNGCRRAATTAELPNTSISYDAVDVLVRLYPVIQNPQRYRPGVWRPCLQHFRHYYKYNGAPWWMTNV